MDNSAKKIKNILVATDFSKNSDLAILRAIDLAKTTKANLTIMHVVQEKSMDSLFESTLKKLLPKALWLTKKKHSTTFLQETVDALIDHELRIQSVLIKHGKPAVKILQHAKKNKFDLLVVGAHGKFSLRNTFIGTTAEYLADKTHCPVLIVKNSSKNSFKHILVPTDFSLVSKKALNYAFKLFSTSHIHLFHVGDYIFENLLKREEIKSEIPKNKIAKIRKAILLYLDNKMKKFIKGNGKKRGKFSSKIILGYPAASIIKEANKSKIGVIVMGTQGHGRNHVPFMGGVAKRVLIDGDKDILLVPPKTTV